MLRSLKAASLSVGRQVGISRLVGRSRWRRRRLLIICYHGVSLSDEHHWNPALYVPPSTLARRLQMLDQHRCTVLPLGQALERLAHGELPDRAVALTFDDGYYDFMAQAWPLLRQAGYPATVYLTTQRCEHNFPIFNLLLSYVMWKRRDSTLEGGGLPGLGQNQKTWPLATERDREAVIAAITKHVQETTATPAEKDDIARELAKRLGQDYDSFVRDRFLTIMRPSEVTSMAADGVDFQLHTHRHRSPTDPARFQEEIQQNRRRIEAMTGVRPTHFCYPSGVVRPQYLPVLEGEGVVSATTTRLGIADVSTKALLLPRFVDTDRTSDIEFESWLQGILPLLRGVA